ncbi:MAG: ATP-binding protein [Oscillospiraceae bacterium]|nr:ATP-binding protein [Oscillospiraceae bacterium]
MLLQKGEVIRLKELSLNILDVAENSVRAGATLVEISLTQENGTLTITIQDDGCGMSREILEQVENPFYTTRTTRSVGLGIPLYKMAAEQTGGTVTIRSVEKADDSEHHGTTVTALFYTDHIDCAPLGDIVSTVCTLIHGSPQIDFVFTHKTSEREVSLDTRELRAVLGDEISLDNFEVMRWIRESLEEQYQS